MIGCERKCQFLTFFVALIEIWLQNQIKRIISDILPTFFVWIRHIWENKNITSSGCSHCFSVNFRFFGHFRLAEVIETPTKPKFQPLSMSSKILSLKKNSSGQSYSLIFVSRIAGVSISQIIRPYQRDNVLFINSRSVRTVGSFRHNFSSNSLKFKS